jgi:hypothetical protein
VSSLAPSPKAPDSGLGWAARVTRVAAASCFAAWSLLVLTEVAFDSARQSAPPPPPPRTPGNVSERAPASAGPHALTSAPGATEPATPEPTAPAGPLSPRQILIDLGPPRSEVFVDGRRVGHTPFVGQVMCRPGREISNHVVPARGFPLEEQRVCPH